METGGEEGIPDNATKGKQSCTRVGGNGGRKMMSEQRRGNICIQSRQELITQQDSILENGMNLSRPRIMSMPDKRQ